MNFFNVRSFFLARLLSSFIIFNRFINSRRFIFAENTIKDLQFKIGEAYMNLYEISVGYISRKFQNFSFLRKNDKIYKLKFLNFLEI